MRIHTGVLSMLLCAGLMVAGTGCEEEATPSDPTPPRAEQEPLPDNLCELVAPQVSDDWELEELNNTVRDDTSDCTLGSEDTRLIVSFTAVPEDELDSALAEACDLFVYEQPEEGENRCVRVDELDGEPSGRITEAALIRDRSGVVVITMQTDDRDRADLVGAEVATVEAAFAFS